MENKKKNIFTRMKEREKSFRCLKELEKGGFI